MTMQMQRAFNHKMLSRVYKLGITKGAYDLDNIWVEGEVTTTSMWGVIKAGNKFSQFEEGIALHPDDGGIRYSDYKTLYITDKFSLEKGDKIKTKGKFYNIVQMSDESVYGFSSYIIEESEDWTP